MRKIIKVPRILKINKVENQSIYVTFNNGETRAINFGQLLKNLGLDQNSPAYVLANDSQLKKAVLRNYTLSFDNVPQYITLKNGHKEKVPFEIGADTLLKHSEAVHNETNFPVGKILREARQKAGITQQELANMSGTSRTYISRIENDRSDVEIATLKKIIEVGLGRKLEISIK